MSARERAFSLLRDRNLTICDRLTALLSLALDVQDGMDMGDLSMPMEGGPLRGRPKAEDFAEMLRFFEALEPIDPRWPGTLARMRGNLDGLLEAAPRFLAALGEGAYAYEHLAVYYVYRYWMKAAFDGELLSRMKFALCGLLVQLLWDVDRWVRTGGYTPDDRVESAKAFSKEMEYGPDNLAAFLKKSWELDRFSSEAIGGMLGICRCE